MASFIASTNAQILISIEYINMMLSSGYSKEHIMVELGKEKLGKVSIAFRKIINRMHSGSDMESALKSQIKTTQNPDLKKLLSYVNSQDGVDITDMLSLLSQEVIRKTQLNSKIQTDTIEASVPRAVIIFAIPILIFFAELMENALGNIGIEMIFRPNIDYILYGLAAVLMLFLLFRMRCKE